MPQVEVDVQNIPDIIEAQLTLSYSRLSDLIRIIVDQGNSHDDEITGIHDDVVELRSENEALRKEVELLKARGSDDSLRATVELLKKEVERLSATSDRHDTQLKDNHDARTAEEKALRDLLDEQSRLLKSLKQSLDDTKQQVRGHDSRLGLASAFAELWGGRPEQILTMAAHTVPNDGNSDYEHDIKARTQYLHTLPAFATLFDELGVMRGMLQKQSAETIATKTEMRSRQNSEVGSPSVQDALKVAEELEARLALIENRRLPPLEDAVLNGASPKETGNANAAVVTAASTVSEADFSAAQKDISQLQDRLSLLDDRLRALLGQQTTSSGEVSHIALTDLTHRVEWLEEVVEGLPASNAAAAAAAAAAAVPAARTSTADGPHDAEAAAVEERRTPEEPAAAAADVEAASPAPQVPSSVSSAAGSQRPGSANGKPPVRPPSARAHGHLPPISPPQSGTPLTGPGRGSVLGGHLNSVPQPVLESLKAQEDEQPRDRRRASRSISVAMEPEDGLRRRVALVEENCAILEVNKVDRTELLALEDAIRQALAQHQLGVLPATDSAPANAGPIAPRRPPTTRVSLTDNTGIGMGDGVVMRPRSSQGGRPMFVGSSSVYLRDGAVRTQVTVSPTRLSGTY